MLSCLNVNLIGGGGHGTITFFNRFSNVYSMLCNWVHETGYRVLFFTSFLCLFYIEEALFLFGICAALLLYVGRFLFHTITTLYI